MNRFVSSMVLPSGHSHIVATPSLGICYTQSTPGTCTVTD